MEVAEVSLTLDLEDHRMGGDPSYRFVHNAEKLLDFLRALDARATIFVVGDAIDKLVGLIRRAADEGHELALHSFTHVPLQQCAPGVLATELKEARRRLEDLTGNRVSGFRAPLFSLTRETVWVTDMLAELDFDYSSSVLPARNPQFGYRDAPRVPFCWPSGLLELPVPVLSMGLWELPFLGGLYLRYMPLSLIIRGARERANECLWSYLHPYDIDAEEGFYRFPGTSLLTSVLLWRRRRNTLARLAKLSQMTGGPAPPLCERSRQIAIEGGAPCYHPA